ncbi:MAG: hypothetical protein H6Q26_2045 [Bacteroidetes bacterium]|nr:hypothetical protein [Bacteroidota bacterium]
MFPFYCTAYGSRTRHSSVKGRRLSRLTNAAFRDWDCKGSQLLNISKFISKKSGVFSHFHVYDAFT